MSRNHVLAMAIGGVFVLLVSAVVLSGWLGRSDSSSPTGANDGGREPVTEPRDAVSLAPGGVQDQHQPSPPNGGEPWEPPPRSTRESVEVVGIDLQLTADAVELLDLSDTEAGAVRSLLSRTHEVFADLDLDRVETTRTDSSVAFRIPSLDPELATSYRDKFVAELTKILGDERADFFRVASRRTMRLANGDFGQTDRMIVFKQAGKEEAAWDVMILAADGAAAPAGHDGSVAFSSDSMDSIAFPAREVPSGLKHLVEGAEAHSAP